MTMITCSLWMLALHARAPTQEQNLAVARRAEHSRLIDFQPYCDPGGSNCLICDATKPRSVTRPLGNRDSPS
jgi:hypothetical protein